MGAGNSAGTEKPGKKGGLVGEEGERAMRMGLESPER